MKHLGLIPAAALTLALGTGAALAEAHISIDGDGLPDNGGTPSVDVNVSSDGVQLSVSNGARTVNIDTTVLPDSAFEVDGIEDNPNLPDLDDLLGDVPGFDDLPDLPDLPDLGSLRDLEVDLMQAGLSAGQIERICMALNDRGCDAD